MRAQAATLAAVLSLCLAGGLHAQTTIALVGGADSGAINTNGDFELLTPFFATQGTLAADAEQVLIDNAGSVGAGIAIAAGPTDAETIDIATDPFIAIIRSTVASGGSGAFGFDNSAGTPLSPPGGTNTVAFQNNGRVVVSPSDFFIGETIGEGIGAG